MIPIKQKQLHIEGQQAGDCWRACIASIIECDINLLPLPVLNGSADSYNNMCEKLLEFNYQLFWYAIDNLETNKLDSIDTDGYIIAIGKSPRSTENKRINHAVVWKNGIAFDPHPDNTGILDILEFNVLRKIKNDSDIKASTLIDKEKYYKI